MKAGTEIQTLAERIMQQAKSKKDYVADTRMLELTDGFSKDRNVAIQFTTGEGKTRHNYQLTPLCLSQIGERVGIPSKYLNRMAEEAPNLLKQNVNYWFTNSPEKRMVRTFDNGEKVARAFLSDRYRALDNHDLANAVLPQLTKAGCEIASAELTETRLYIQATTPLLKAVIERRKSEAPNEHIVGAINDVVQAGVVISNSEVGCGSIRVEPMLYTLRCRNGLIVSSSLRRHHVGRGHGFDDVDDAQKVFTDETRKLDDRAFWSKVRDVVSSSLTEIKFRETVAKLNRSTTEPLGNPIDVVEVVADKFALNETEYESVLQHLCKGGDLTKYGLLNAVTRTAEDVESYDRAIELERFGGMVLELPAKDFSKN